MVQRAVRALVNVRRGGIGRPQEAPENVRTLQCSTDTAIGSTVLNPVAKDGNCLFSSLAVAVTEFIPPLGRIVHFSASGGGVDLIP